MSDHDFTQESLDAFVAGGLTRDEQGTIERHVAACSECAAGLAQAQKLEASLTTLFADATPRPDLEDRVIGRLRRHPARNPMWLRYVMSAAAVFVLGFIGAIAQAVVSKDGIVLDGLSPGHMKSTFSAVSQTIGNAGGEGVEGRKFNTRDVDPASTEFDVDINYMPERIGRISVPGSVNPNEPIGILDGGKLGKRNEEGLVSGNFVPSTAGEIGGYNPAGVPLQGTFYGRSGESHESDLRRGGGASKDGRQINGVPFRTENTFGFDLGTQLNWHSNGAAARRDNDATLPQVKPAQDPANPAGSSSGSMISGLTPGGIQTPDVGNRITRGLIGGSSKKIVPSGNNYVPAEELMPELREKPGSPGYFKPGAESEKATQSLPPPKSALPIKPSDGPKETSNQGAKKIGEKKEEQFEIGLIQPEKGQPLETSRKIIRTGDMDFEVESFDAAYGGVDKLIAAVKGGFIATTNSDKLPNGKMKGAVVVRMPPQYLDKFILDLRGLLTKNGELKSQRIGSADVTKQYTDIESELRAARAVESRLVEIIKTGKGEIKDLVAAERELGTWRTKIEKMEGEIRYYNNMVSLSTLTINLVEKELSTPFALVTSEKVQMKIEVDSVPAALEAAVKAVEAVKGRVLKSESKQHKAGQVEAILHAEIPPPQKDAFHKELKKLGITSEDEASSSTLAQGGTGKPVAAAPRKNDVVFEISMYNVVNIPPRQSVKLKVASTDVAANYAKLEAFVLAKGQMRVANLSEPDKLRVTAYLEFNVPNDQKEAADKLIAAIGPQLEKKNEQVPVTEIATNQKFGYVVNLYSVATIAPQERITLRIEVANVAAIANEIETLGKASKGQVEKGRFVQSAQGQTSTAVAMHVPLSASGGLVDDIMKKAKKVIEREVTPNPNTPQNELSTALIIVNITGGDQIVPSDESLGTQIQKGLYFAFWLLSRGLLLVVIGICGVLPWIIVIWGGVKLFLWVFEKKPAAQTPATGASPSV